MIVEETKTIRYRMVEGDVLEMIYKDNIALGVAETEENHQLYLQFIQGKTSFKRLVILGKNMSVNADARLLCKKFDEEESHKITAQATVCQTYLNKILAYVYFKMLAPKYANKVFSNRQFALDWLMKIN